MKSQSPVQTRQCRTVTFLWFHFRVKMASNNKTEMMQADTHVNIFSLVTSLAVCTRTCIVFSCSSLSAFCHLSKYACFRFLTKRKRQNLCVVECLCLFTVHRATVRRSAAVRRICPTVNVSNNSFKYIIYVSFITLYGTVFRC